MNLLTVKQVIDKLNCSRSFLWTLRKKDPTFPKPFAIGLGEERTRGSRWVEAELDQWLLTRQQLTAKKEAPCDHEDGRDRPAVHQAA